MNNQPITFGIIGLLAGIILTGFTASYAVNHNNTSMMGAMGIRTDTTNVTNTLTRATSSRMMMENADDPTTMSMADMRANLTGLSGDAFDKEFISEMIVHHQGAITMAKLAAAQAKHQEVKDLANNIISAQTNEITQMQAWQKSWGL